MIHCWGAEEKRDRGHTFEPMKEGATSAAMRGMSIGPGAVDRVSGFVSGLGIHWLGHG